MKYHQLQIIKSYWNDARQINWKCSRCPDTIMPFVEQAIKHAISHGFKIPCAICGALFMNKKKMRQHFSKIHKI